jgi:hypothetical protein
MSDIGGAFDEYREIETGEAFTAQSPYLLKVELAETSVMARGGSSCSGFEISRSLCRRKNLEPASRTRPQRR